MNKPLNILRHHVSGAIERGEKEAITSIVETNENEQIVEQNVSVMRDRLRTSEEIKHKERVLVKDIMDDSTHYVIKEN